MFNNEKRFVPGVLTIIPKIPVKGLLYIGQYGTSGYATAAKGYLYHYFSNKIPITWEPLYFDDSKLSDDDLYDIIIKSLINKPLKDIEMIIMHSTPDLWPQFWQEKEDILSNKIVIGYCTWESSRLPKKWSKYMNGYVNEIWCPSTYNEQSFKESGVIKPIKVVPHIFLPYPLPSQDTINLINVENGDKIKKQDRYVFYSIGEFNTRKGIEDSIEAYCKAFDKKDRVLLILKVHYRNYSNNNKLKCEELILKEINKYPNHPPIVGLFNNMTFNEMLALHSIGDCYLALTKAEGFGLTIFDAYNYNKNIIATGYSGHIDFLGKNYPGLVNYKLGSVKGMSMFSPNYTEEQEWAYPDINHAIELMRNIIKK